MLIEIEKHGIVAQPMFCMLCETKASKMTQVMIEDTTHKILWSRYECECGGVMKVGGVDVKDPDN